MNIKYKEKKICIITNYRSGSSSFCTALSDFNKLPNLGEYFNPVSYDGTGFTIDKALRNLYSMNRYVLKIMPGHLRHDPGLLNTVLSHADKVIYLYRRNFVAQVKSLLAANSTNSFCVNGYKEYDQLPETSIVKVPELSDEFIHKNINILKNNYLVMADCFNKFPGEVFCLEDFPKQNPYHTTVVWKKEVTDISHFDVEGLFSNIHHEMD
jgi:hypothetical protein